MEIIAKDLAHIWHPCTPMKTFEEYPPLIVTQALGSYLETSAGTVIDAISSWWCKSLGHRHPRIIAAIQEQLKHFEHVIAANTTHKSLALFGEHLAEITHKQHVFFASDGSSAVEIALKLVLHAKQLQGQAQRYSFIALENAYHGETLGALSVSDLGIYKKPYQGYGVSCNILRHIPYVTGPEDPLWINCENVWPALLQQLECCKTTACAIIIEPIVQGAGGMLCYSADFLYRLAQWAKVNDIYLIADEIMTGIGRTGAWLAAEHAAIDPDIICLSKGLSAGALPMSCVAVDQAIYTLFYHTNTADGWFLHSHTHSANALAVAAALATLQVITEMHLLSRAVILGQQMRCAFVEISALTGGCLKNIRSIGAWVAADWENPSHPHLNAKFVDIALKNGALLRPIDNTLYWLPPLTTEDHTIDQLFEITLQSIQQFLKS